MKGAEARVRRHLRIHPRASWHLDYLLPIGEPVATILGHTADRLECPLSQVFEQQFQVIPRFGSSDCRCPGHLFHSSNSGSLAKIALDALEGFGCAIKILPLSPEGKDRLGVSESLDGLGFSLSLAVITSFNLSVSIFDFDRLLMSPATDTTFTGRAGFLRQAIYRSIISVNYI